jgi:arsenate reductase
MNHEIASQNACLLHTSLHPVRLQGKSSGGSAMTDTVTIYHNPQCSKSCQTLELLEGEGIVPKVVKYLEAPPDAATLNSLLNMLNLEPRELMRKGEAEYTDLNLSNPALSREQLIVIMVEYPRLIERPIVVKDGKAIIGRPPEKVLELL